MISLFDLFKIGVGPSSSHTVGPMLAALRFVELLDVLSREKQPLAQVARIQVELFGSLALTGLGHRTDRAVVAGLMGHHPRSVDPAQIEPLYQLVETTGELLWLGKTKLEFQLKRDLQFHYSQFLPQHPNGLRCSAFDAHEELLLSREYFSVGGGFVVEAEELAAQQKEGAQCAEDAGPSVPFHFASAEELLGICHREQLSIAQVVQRNELSWRTETQIAESLDEIWEVMQVCIADGCVNEGVLPGGLGIRRRAPAIHGKLKNEQTQDNIDETVSVDPLRRLDWVNLFALAVNEQNAAGGRVVTSPTNGAAGVIPAVCGYYSRFQPGATRAGVHEFLKTAAAVGMLFKRNASLSAAEMGCQGEVGVACSMAAAGLAAVMGGTPQQIENAAEIGMEHNLGLTCDPVAGLVQIPCIERNTMGAVKAINAARLAVLYGDGQHRVSLDKVIETMRQTGIDMQSKYKETSLGGLAVNVTVC